MHEGGFKCEIQAFGRDAGVASEVKERADAGNDRLLRRNLNLGAVVHNLEEFVECQLLVLGLVIVNGKNVLGFYETGELNENEPK